MGSIINRAMILGLPVICEKTGKRLGIVDNIQYDAGYERIIGIIVMGPNDESEVFSIEFDKIKVFGPSAIMVGDDYIRKAEIEGQDHVIGRSIVGDHGQELGSISDIVFNSHSGHIEGYEISKGILDDLIAGRNILSGDFRPFSDGNVVVIPMEGDVGLKSNKRGILNILSEL